MLHRVEGEPLAPLLAACFPVPQVITRFIHGSGSNPFWNKIPTDAVLWLPVSIRPPAIGAVRNLQP
jgi:hypothetical protein